MVNMTYTQEELNGLERALQDDLERLFVRDQPDLARRRHFWEKLKATSLAVALVFAALAMVGMIVFMVLCNPSVALIDRVKNLPAMNITVIYVVSMTAVVVLSIVAGFVAGIGEEASHARFQAWTNKSWGVKLGGIGWPGWTITGNRITPRVPQELFDLESVPADLTSTRSYLARLHDTKMGG